MRHERTVTSLYKRHENCTGGRCFYCSMPASTIDHIPAVSAVESLGVDVFNELVFVTCCLECNSELGNRWLNSVAERSGYLKAVYQRKYAAALRMPDWDKEELDSIDGTTLRSSIEAGLKLRDVQRARVAYLTDVTAMYS